MQHEPFDIPIALFLSFFSFVIRARAHKKTHPGKDSFSVFLPDFVGSKHRRLLLANNHVVVIGFADAGCRVFLQH